MNGSVLLFDNQKGWGFIRGSDNKDYFVHYSNIETDRKRNLSEEDIDNEIKMMHFFTR